MRFGTKSIVVRDGKILLIKRSNYNNYRVGEWDLPGGRLKEGERLFDGHKREVFEETMLSVEIVEPVKSWAVDLPDGRHAGITFLSKHVSGEVKLSNEHTEFKWVAPEEIMETSAAEWINEEVNLAEEINPKLFHSRQKL